MSVSCVADTDKEKLCLGDDVDLGGGGGSDMGPSAALTPAIWDKTIPYDGENFHLEYMDLEEFLMENGIPTLPDEESPKGVTKAEKAKATPSTQLKVTKLPNISQVALLPIQELEKDDEELLIIKGDSDIICDVTAGECSMEGQWLATECFNHVMHMLTETPVIEKSDLLVMNMTE